MGNLLGEPFKDYVTDQINDRQAVHGKANRTIEEIQYLNSRNAWIKLASGTSMDQSRLDLLKKNRGDQEENPLLIGVVPGQDLAIRNVLFNGLSSFGKSQLYSPTQTLSNEEAAKENYETLLEKPSFQQVQRAGITGANRAYGVGGTSQHGFSPMPGIIDADIKDLNRGSIKKATINIKAHNRNQFDVIDALYLRLGYSIMLEWGVDKYLDGLKSGNGDIESMGTTLIDRKFWKYNKSSYNEILPEIEELRKKYKGNYDGFFGVISNFSWTFEADGTYNIKLELMSQGDIIESLKANLPSVIGDNKDAYKNIRLGQLEQSPAISQEIFYNDLYPGLREIIENWYNLAKEGKGAFQVGRPRFSQYGLSFGVGEKAFPNLDVSSYKNDRSNQSIKNLTNIQQAEKLLPSFGKILLRSLIQVEKLQIDQTNFTARNYKNELIDEQTLPTEGMNRKQWLTRNSDLVQFEEDASSTLDFVVDPFGFLEGFEGSEFLAPEIKSLAYPKTSFLDYVAEEDYKSESNENYVNRLLVVNNISLNLILSETFKLYKEAGVAGGPEDPQFKNEPIMDNEGNISTEAIANRFGFATVDGQVELLITEEVKARREFLLEYERNLELNKGKNKVFEYFYLIRTYQGPKVPTSITALDTNVGNVVNPTRNEADEWNKQVKFPIYKPTTNPFSTVVAAGAGNEINQTNEENPPTFNQLFSNYYPIDVVKLETSNPANSDFIRLGTFLEFFEQKIIPKIETKSQKQSGQPMLLIDYDPNNNICYTVDNLISIDPTKTILNNSNFYSPEPQKIYPELNQFIYRVDEFLYGNIMNIYFSFNRIEEIMDGVDANNQISVYKVLKSLATDINESLGNVNNIEPVIDKETNTIRFIDQTPIPGLKTIAKSLPGYKRFSKKSATLEVLGLNPKDNTSNFVRSAGITTEISKEYATIITIGATANGAIPGAESTAFSKWNVGIEDRFKIKIIDGEANIEDSLKKQNAKILNNYVNFIGQQFDKLGFSYENNKLVINSKFIKLNKESTSNFYIYAQAQTSNENSTYLESSIGFLPFNLKLSMDGLSGIKIFNKINVNTAFLPSNYDETLSFIITGVNHKLSNNEWITSLDTIATTKEKQDVIPSVIDTEELLQPKPTTRTSEGPVAPLLTDELSEEEQLQLQASAEAERIEAERIEAETAAASSFSTRQFGG